MMRTRFSLHLTLLMLRASAALALTALPLHLSFDGAMPKLVAAVAMADNDHSGSDNSGSGSDDHGGSDNDDDNGSDDHGGGNDDGGHDDDNSGPGNGRDDDDRGDNNDNDNDNDREHVNPATGARVEVGRNSIEVVHRDGTKEELDNGIYEMKDARGRTIIERRATTRDIARMNNLAR